MKPHNMWRVYVIGTAVAVCLVIAGAAAFAVLQMRDSMQSGINTTTRNLAISVKQTVEGLVDAIDVALQASADEIARQDASGHANGQSISDYLDLQARRLPHVAYLRGTDASGDVVYGPGRPSKAVNLSDRTFFAQLRDDPHRGLYMSKPVVAKITGNS